MKYDCKLVILQFCGAKEDLRGTSLLSPYLTQITDGSSFMEHGIHQAGYALVILTTSESHLLSPGWRAHLADMIAFIRTFKLDKDRRVNIYTYSKYAFLVLQAHAAIWKARQS